MPIQTVSTDWIPLGYARFATVSSAITLGSTAPTAGTAYTALTLNGLSVTPRHAVINIETQSVRVRDDGTAPTASEGTLVAAGSTIVMENETDALRQTKIIETAASAQVTVRWYF
jgi:hypothetical protein